MKIVCFLSYSDKHPLVYVPMTNDSFCLFNMENIQFNYFFLVELQPSIRRLSVAAACQAPILSRPPSAIPAISCGRVQLVTSTSINQHRRLISSSKYLATASKSGNTIDDFRASEEKIEREFEAKHKDETSSSGQQTQSNKNAESDERIEGIRCRILDAALPFVITHGWSREAISAGAETCGLPGVVHGMFPNGGAELVHHFYTKCNRELVERLKTEADARSPDDPAPVPTEFIARAIKLRLQMIEPYAETWPKALAVMTLPQNVPTSLAQLLTLIDDICYYAGDRSVDVSIYLLIAIPCICMYIAPVYFICLFQLLFRLAGIRDVSG